MSAGRRQRADNLTSIKVTTGAAAALLAAAALACQAQTRQSPPAPAEAATVSPGASVEQRSFIKRYIFADVSLEEIFGAAKSGDDTPPEGIEHFRISVLTYAGIHVVESYGPATTTADPAYPALYASSRLVQAFNEYTDKHPPGAAPPPPGGGR